jgi:hypothetical protein
MATSGAGALRQGAEGASGPSTGRQKMKTENKIAIAGLVLTLLTGVGVPLGLKVFEAAPAQPADPATTPTAPTSSRTEDDLASRVANCIKGSWKLKTFRAPEFSNSQPNNPHFSWSGYSLLTFGEGGKGSLEIDRTVTTTYDPESNWASIDDKMTGKISFEYLVNADSTTGKAVLTYANESGNVQVTSKGAGIEPKDEKAALQLVGRSVTCGSGQLELESVDSKRVDVYGRP